VEKEVIVQYDNENHERVSDTTHFSWTSIYRKTDKGWKIENVTSTHQ